MCLTRYMFVPAFIESISTVCNQPDNMKSMLGTLILSGTMVMVILTGASLVGAADICQ